MTDGVDEAVDDGGGVDCDGGGTPSGVFEDGTGGFDGETDDGGCGRREGKGGAVSTEKRKEGEKGGGYGRGREENKTHLQQPSPCQHQPG